MTQMMQILLSATALFSNALTKQQKEKGWWDKERNDAECIALMHSELSESLEALRNGNMPDDKIPQYSGVEAELADTIIRIMDFSQARNFDVAGAILAKIEFNKNREKMHGGKKF